MTKQQSTIPAASHTDPFSRKYKIIAKIGEGSYSEVLKCKNRESGSVYACKRLKHCYRSWNQVNDIPEVVTLRKLARHPNILQMVEIHFDPTAGRVSLVFELMDMNLYELIKDRKRLLPESRVRVMMFQLMRALRHLHKHGIFHRDVKPENILLRNDLLKLGDLGSVRGLYSRPPYTEYISTRWYRSPECLLTCGYYSFKMDVWAAGCVFYEILTLRPLFPGSSELDQINRIHNVLGPPPTKILQKFSKHAEIERDYSRHSSKQARLDTIKRVLSDMKNSNFDWYFTGKEPKGVNTLLPTHVTSEAKDLLILLLQYDPDARPSSHRALQHAYFKELREQAQRAAREKVPAQHGPIVTIVGDEGGLEVTQDDNANPVDLATLGDAKIKLKAHRHTTEIKELTETTSSRKTLHQESSPKLPFDTPYLKEAGEAFSREPAHPDLKSLSVNSSFDSTKSEEKSKARALLKLGGDAANSLPYQKVFLRDEEDGDGPSNKSTYSAAFLEDKRKHSSLIRRRLSSKIEIERKKSVTSISQDASSSPHGGRHFPLELIDKTALTPDVLARINENRRIAQMLPLTDPKRLQEVKDSEKLKSEVRQILQEKLPQSPANFSPRNFQQQASNNRNPPKPLKVDHLTPPVLSLKEDRKSESPPSISIPRYTHSVTNKQVKEVLAALPAKKKFQPSKPPERIKETEEQPVKQQLQGATSSKSSHSRNQLIKNLSALRTKYEAESKSLLNRNADKSISTELNVKSSSVMKKNESSASNKPSYTGITAHKLKKEQQQPERKDFSERRYTNRDYVPLESEERRNRQYSEKQVTAAYDRAVERLTNRRNNAERPREGIRTDRYEKGVVHRYELSNRVTDWRDDDHLRQRHSPPERRDYSERQAKDPLERHVYEYQYTMASRKSSILGHKRSENNSKSDGNKTDGNYDSPGSLSPASFRKVVENRRNAELVTTDTDGEGDASYLQQHRRLEGARRKKRSRHHRTGELLSDRTQRTDDVKSKSNYSPRSTLHQQTKSLHQQRDPALDRVSVTMAAAAKYSNSSSLANKQVREILAEMRKRRDLLEEKVTKDPSLMSWVKKTENPRAGSKISDTVVKKTNKDGISRDDFREPYAVYKATHNKTNYPAKRHNAASVAELGPAAAEKLIQSRRRPEEYDYSSRVKLNRQESIPKYIDSEGKLLKSSTDRPKQNHQSNTGAGSKAFPRNRYGTNVHK